VTQKHIPNVSNKDLEFILITGIAKKNGCQTGCWTKDQNKSLPLCGTLKDLELSLFSRVALLFGGEEAVSGRPVTQCTKQSVASTRLHKKLYNFSV
jgi:hypothetical protein